MLSLGVKLVIVVLSSVFMSSTLLHVSYCQEPIVNSGKINGTLEMGGGLRINASSAMGASNNTQTTNTPSEMKYESAREQFLKVWDTLGFHPLGVTFVNESAELGNGVYQEHPNVFNPDETITLYVQPIGFGHKEITGQNGERLFLMNFTADIIVTAPNGTVLAGWQNLPAGQILSHYQNTELYLHLLITHDQPFPKGDYKFNYVVTDEITGNIFKLTKDVKIV